MYKLRFVIVERCWEVLRGVGRCWEGSCVGSDSGPSFGPLSLFAPYSERAQRMVSLWFPMSSAAMSRLHQLLPHEQDFVLYFFLVIKITNPVCVYPCIWTLAISVGSHYEGLTCKSFCYYRRLIMAGLRNGCLDIFQMNRIFTPKVGQCPHLQSLWFSVPVAQSYLL